MQNSLIRRTVFLVFSYFQNSLSNKKTSNYQLWPDQPVTPFCCLFFYFLSRSSEGRNFPMCMLPVLLQIISKFYGCFITMNFYFSFFPSTLCFVLHFILFFMSIVFLCSLISTLCYVLYLIPLFIPCVDMYFIPHSILYFTVTGTPTTTVTTTAAVN